MKVAIIGAGAIGGCLGARLASAGAVTSALARGATLAALQRHGWRMQAADGEGLLKAPVAAAARAEALGVQDLVVVAVKGPALAAVAPSLAPLLGPQTVVLPAMNGVPWWFCRGRPGFEAPLESVDPGGAIGAAIPFERVLGCVVHFSAATPEPGLVRHQMGRRLILGEPGGGDSPRLQRVATLLRGAGFEADVSPDVRQDIWFKLWGNLTMNPVSAITGATTAAILDDPYVRAFCSRVMLEADAIGQRIGCTVGQTPEARHAVTAKLGAFRSSMLQDVLADRPIELDAIVGAVHEIGRRVGVAAPNVEALLGLTRLFGRVKGLYGPAG